MKLYVSLITLGLLQLSLPTGVAQEERRNLRRGDADKQNEEPESEEMERELRPFGYPAPRSRPGQSRTYGLTSMVGFTPYTNSNQYVSDVQQRGGAIPQQPGRGAIRQQPETVPFNEQPGSLLVPAPRNFGRAGRGRRRRARPNRRFVPAPGGPPKRADGSYDGTFVIGVPKTGSLAQALGFYRVEQGEQVVFVEDENDDTIVFTPAPTGTNAPTISPAPTLPVTESPTATPTTARPTNSPTANPTSNPTTKPTRSPTGSPTRKPTNQPTLKPTPAPTSEPTNQPTKKPTNQPTDAASF